MGRVWEKEFTVHPRVCGGSCIIEFGRWVHVGTSPRVRGKPGNVVSSRIIIGYIPACAGEARRGRGANIRGKVHPRVCGGSHRPGARAGDYAGTSPRVRGKRRRADAESKHPGYIPACAGEAGR